ncbi:hypothetical protein [Nonomuraea sp. NPDC049646]|uniref:hypothetical protein n=1 Tax=unclassified Nonomuraea TaxID=2593643 RepID=UPI0037953A42
MMGGGGHALELAAGRACREHDDVDIAPPPPDRPDNHAGRLPAPRTGSAAPPQVHGPRPKDEIDFETVLPLLDDGRRRWPAAALRTEHATHP